ncbi:MAG: zf-HC2 domain-containing protein [Pseudomonadota bacterium]
MSVFIVCKQAHQLISEGLDRPLSLSERTQLKMHLAICRACTGFDGQMSFLRKAMKKTASEGLPAEADNTGSESSTK